MTTIITRGDVKTKRELFIEMLIELETLLEKEPDKDNFWIHGAVSDVKDFARWASTKDHIYPDTWFTEVAGWKAKYAEVVGFGR